MNVFARIRRWFDRSAAAPAADPGDLHQDPPDDAAASSGLERPFPAAGPIADPPIGDPPPTDPPERPLG
jgi:hypothetical protein